MLKFTATLSTFFLITSLAAAADSSHKEALTQSIKALSDTPNYTWKSTTEVPPDTQFRPGPIEGKVEKGGLLHVRSSFGRGTTETIKQGDKIAMTNRDGAWESIAEIESNTEGFGRFRAMMARGLAAPAEDALETLKDINELKKDGDVYAGEISEEGAKALMSFGGRRRGGQGDGPAISEAKASAKFWTKQGLLSKVEIKMSGSMEFNGNKVDIIRTTTTEITDIGHTKIEIPDAAKAKLN